MTCATRCLCAWHPVDLKCRGCCMIGPHQGQRRGGHSPACEWHLSLADFEAARKRARAKFVAMVEQEHDCEELAR